MNKFLKLIERPETFAILSGLLAGQTLLARDWIPAGHWAIFFCFVPLWVVWGRTQSWKRIFWTGWIAQFLVGIIGFPWIARTVKEFGHLSWPLSVLVLLLYAALANLHIPLSGVIWKILFHNRAISTPSKFLCLAAITALLEQFFPRLFPWNFGYVWFYKQWPAFQLADVVGMIGLSAITYIFNSILLMSWQMRGKKSFLPISIFLLLFGAMNLAGHFREQNLPDPDRVLPVLAIQGNIGNQDKIKAESGEEYREKILKTYFQLTSLALASHPEVRVVIWPENAFPEFILDKNLSTKYPTALRDFLGIKNIFLLTGGYGFQLESEKVTNSFFWISPSGEWVSEPYEKKLLLPFGEYIPGQTLFPKLRSILPHVRDYGAGSGSGIIEGQEIKIGAQICYEGLFDSHTIDLAKAGAQALINVTNDSWYGNSLQPYQHVYMTLARAVEVRRPMIRVTNTGITASVDTHGKWSDFSPIHEPWFGKFELSYVAAPGLTIFVRWGRWLLPFLLSLGLSFALLRERRTTSGLPGGSSSDQ